MDLTNYAGEISIGVLSSIIASIIVICIQSIRVRQNLKNEIGFNLEFAADSIYAACSASDFSIASSNVSRAMDYIQKSWVAIKSRRHSSWRFFFTVTYSIYRGCSICLNELAINEGKSLKQYTQEYLGDSDDGHLPRSYLILLMLINMNYGRSLADSCRGTIAPLNSTIDEIEKMIVSCQYVDANSYKGDYYNKTIFRIYKKGCYNLKNNCFTINGYRNYVYMALRAHNYKILIGKGHSIRKY